MIYIFPGIVLTLAFSALAPLLDVSAKLAIENEIFVGQITTARSVVQATLMLPVLMWMGLPWAVNWRVLGFVSLRAVFLILSTFSFVSGFAVMPVADALAIAFCRAVHPIDAGQSELWR